MSLCQTCGKPMGLFRSTGEPRNRSELSKIRRGIIKFCSLECSGKAQYGSVDDIKSKLVLQPDSGCLLWSGYRLPKGYGQVKFKGKNYLVHKLLWEEVNGPVLGGLQLDHNRAICISKACANLDHLRLLTPKGNILLSNNMAARFARRTVCDKCGGPFERFKGSGIRFCRACRNAKMMIAQRIRRAAKKIKDSHEE